MTAIEIKSIKDYVPLALVTEATPSITPLVMPPDLFRLIHAGMGLTTEFAELTEAADKGDSVHVLEEIGDGFWYTAIAHDVLYAGFAGDVFERTIAEPMDGMPEAGPIVSIGEFVDVCKRSFAYGKPLDLVRVKKALATTTKFLAMACEFHKLNLNDVLERNINKLAKRYGPKFDAYLATHRDLVVERKVLEGDKP